MDRNKVNGTKKPGKRRPRAAAEGGTSVEERIKGAYSRPPLARMLRLHEWLMANRYPNCRKIAEEFEVSAKTVQRDVNFMRDRMDLPIEYDRARFGFHYTRAVAGFPSAGAAAGQGRRSPWRKGLPPPVGERPALPSPAVRGEAVRIRFDAEIAPIVRRGTWHATQEIQPLPDGTVEMSLRARDEPVIVRWVLSWGGHAWIVEPPRLRTRMREAARAILARH